ncbi:MAG: dTMP kinase [Pseudomonadota bacterium]|nr:dTMP kinase [Pseudomonadota bacterium]
MQNKKGLWVVIEGIDGAGKTTAMQTVLDTFTSYHLPIKAYREPGGTSLGECIRTLLKTDGLGILPFAEVLLFYAARYQLLMQEILPSLRSGTTVLLDRHELSTFAYQAGGRGVDKSNIESLSQLCLQGQKPDLTIFLSVHPRRAYERMHARGKLDHIEQQDLTFFENVALTYEILLEDYPGVMMIDANVSLEMVQDDIRQQLSDWIELRIL